MARFETPDRAKISKGPMRSVEDAMLLEGLILSVAGMGTVFLFLMLLVGMMCIIAKTVRALEAKGLVAGAGAPASKANATVGADMAQIAAVIAIAGRGMGKH